MSHSLSPAHSHASLLSKLVRQIPNACSGVSGCFRSMVNLSFPTRPNCRIMSFWWSVLFGNTSWKFLTEAMVTRPLKLSTYAPMCSFHFGDLFCKTSSNDIRFCLYRCVSTDEVEWPELDAVDVPIGGGGDVAVGR